MLRARLLLEASTIVLAIAVTGCTDPVTPRGPGGPTVVALKAAATTGMTVTSTSPSEGQEATTIDVTIGGSGFEVGAVASFPLNGVDDPRVHVNSTRFVSSGQVVANLTIASDALTVRYDVVVTNTTGKKGIGSEMFAVVLKASTLSGGSVAYGVNSSGYAVGQSTTVSSCSTNTMPALWKPDGTEVILPTAPHCGGTAWTINSSGYISGQLFGPPGTALWVPQADGTYVLQDLGLTPEGTLARNTGAMNDQNEILGWYNGPEIYWRTPTTPWTHMIAPPGATQCAFNRAINSLGEIVARCTVGSTMDAYFWQDHNATPVHLPRPSGTTAPIFPMEINDAGVIVGYTSTAPYYKALKWTPSGSTYPTVEYLPDAGKGAAAYSIASDGTVSGSISGKAAMWSPSGVYTFLHYSGNSSGGEAEDVVVGTNGFLYLAGYQNNNLAVRWRPSFLGP